MQVGDLNLEGPTSGSRGSVYSPPNGGCRAWMLVLACFVINLCNAVVSLMLVSNIIRDFTNEFGSDKANDIAEAFTVVRKIGVVVAAILMVPLGYRIVGIIGCGMYGVGLFVSSWLTKDQDDFAAFLLGGLSGLGSSFLLLTAIVPPLEYFSSKRLRAISIVRIGEIIGHTVILFVYIPLSIVKEAHYKWEINFRYQLIPVGVALLCCATLKPLELKSSNSKTNLVSRLAGTVDWKLFKDLVLYLILILIFMDHIGKPMSRKQYISLLEEMESDDINAKIITVIIPYLGEVAGLILMVLCCCWKNRKIGTVLILIGVINALIGILACVAPSLKTFGLVAMFGALFGVSKGVFNTLLDSSVPDIFGRGHVRIVEGLFGLMIGIAQLVISPAYEEILDTYEKDPWKMGFYVGGGVLIASGVLAILTRFRKPQDYK
ncbi:monocarboxylate transporter 12-B-like [Argopecten irradians]|uniref:monocarboxylate transporter 12-B-like n=1 Tax=Argopecten irradians TaxID=31199 RepID=UPI00371C26F8